MRKRLAPRSLDGIQAGWRICLTCECAKRALLSARSQTPHHPQIGLNNLHRRCVLAFMLACANQVCRGCKLRGHSIELGRQRRDQHVGHVSRFARCIFTCGFCNWVPIERPSAGLVKITRHDNIANIATFPFADFARRNVPFSSHLLIRKHTGSTRYPKNLMRTFPPGMLEESPPRAECESKALKLISRFRTDISFWDVQGLLQASLPYAFCHCVPLACLHHCPRRL